MKIVAHEINAIHGDDGVAPFAGIVDGNQIHTLKGQLVL